MIHDAEWCIALGQKGSVLQSAVSQTSSNLQERKEALQGAASISCANHSLIDDIRDPETYFAQYRTNDLCRVWWKVLDEADEICSGFIWGFMAFQHFYEFISVFDYLLFWEATSKMSKMTAITSMHLGFLCCGHLTENAFPGFSFSR